MDGEQRKSKQMKKKNIFFWFFLFIILTTFYYDINKTRLAETFKIKKIDILGVENADINLLNLRLERFKYNNFFLIKRNEIASSIIDIDFIDKVLIKKIYPDKVEVKINEHKIVGIILKNKNKYVLSKDGIIVKKYNNKFKTLPKVYGKDVQNYIPQFYEFLKETDFDINEIKSLKHFDTKRWDIVLKTGRIIKLPSNKKEVKKSINKFIAISKDKKFDQFKIFDFRVKNQLIIK